MPVASMTIHACGSAYLSSHCCSTSKPVESLLSLPFVRYLPLLCKVAMSNVCLAMSTPTTMAMVFLLIKRIDRHCIRPTLLMRARSSRYRSDLLDECGGVQRYLRYKLEA